MICVTITIDLVVTDHLPMFRHYQRSNAKWQKKIRKIEE